MSQYELNTKKSHYDGKGVVIDGHHYALRGTTRGGTQRLIQAEADLKVVRDAVEAAGGTPSMDQADQMVHLLCEVVDARLRPVAGSPPAKSILLGAWDEGDLELEQVEDLAEVIGEKAKVLQEALGRPPA